jgi:hypothetical protein
MASQLQQQLEAQLRPHVEAALAEVPPQGPPPGTQAGFTDVAGRIVQVVAGQALQFAANWLAGDIIGPLHVDLVEIQKTHPEFDPALVEDTIRRRLQQLVGGP